MHCSHTQTVLLHLMPVVHTTCCPDRRSQVMAGELGLRPFTQKTVSEGVLIDTKHHHCVMYFSLFSLLSKGQSHSFVNGTLRGFVGEVTLKLYVSSSALMDAQINGTAQYWAKSYCSLLTISHHPVLFNFICRSISSSPGFQGGFLDSSDVYFQLTHRLALWAVLTWLITSLQDHTSHHKTGVFLFHVMLRRLQTILMILNIWNWLILRNNSLNDIQYPVIWVYVAFWPHTK